MSNYVIVTNELTKHYGNFAAVDNLSFTVPEGSICGFLGQNGAGKSTTIKMLLGMVKASGGSATVFGHDISNENESLKIRKKTAFIAEDKRLYDYMTAGQIIQFTRSFFPDWQHKLEKKLLHDFRLPINKKISKFSKGMRTQLALLLGVCRNTPLLVLDEPSEGLDPVNNEKMLKLLVGLASEGKTIFFSSHQVFEVEQIADHIIMINKGKLIDNKPLDHLKYNYKMVKVFFDMMPEDAALDLPNVKRIEKHANAVNFFISGNHKRFLNAVEPLHPSSIDVIDLNLKEIFLENLKAENSYAAV